MGALGPAHGEDGGPPPLKIGPGNETIGGAKGLATVSQVKAPFLECHVLGAWMGLGMWG